MDDVAEVQEDSVRPRTDRSAWNDLLVPDFRFKAALATWTGVDLSHWNGTVNFDQLTAQFVILKVGGSDANRYTDRQYAAWAGEVRRVKKHLGHYWFNGAGDPVADAQYYVRALSHYEDEDLCVLDVESEIAGTPWTPSQALAWFREVKRLKPKARLVVYMSASLTREMDWSSLVHFGVQLWVASYGANTGSKPAGNPLIAHWTSWIIWQYTSVGSIHGIATHVDLDTAHSSLFPAPTPAPAPKPTPAPAPAPTPQESDAMQTIYERQFANNQATKQNEWVTLELAGTAPGEYSFIQDQPGNYSINCTIVFTGVPVGDSAQARLVVTDDQGKALRNTPVVEFAGTPGSTFTSFNRFVALAKGERLRVEVATFSRGAAVSRGDVQWHS